jgi:hypothetical protein
MNENQGSDNILPFLRNQESKASSPLDAVWQVRQPRTDRDSDVGRALIAFDRRDPAAKLDLFKKETAEYLSRCLRGGPYYPDLYGIGAYVLACFELEKSRHWTAEVLGLDRADDAMTNALLAALLGTIATSRNPVDLDTALFGIGSFVHAHPRFAKILGRQRFEPPFGEHTDYSVCAM